MSDAHAQRAAPHRQYIDCARGCAVLMVIACHLAYEFPGLPYPVKRVVTMGWFGVQLFFLASSLTLLMSWHAEARRYGHASRRAFFLRRFFRIAPAYYAAGLLYFFIRPPVSGFDLRQAAASAAFVNAWHPALTPTVAGAWTVVPGGWSISVEFAFYAVFPLFARLVTSLGRAVAAVALCIVAGTLANLLAWHALSPTVTPVALGNFLFFWFPNQAAVFALGGVLYFTLRDGVRLHAWLARSSTALALALAAIAAFCALAFVPLGHFLGDRPLVPAGLIVCLPLFGFVLALSGGGGLFVNRAVAAMGQVSFSAYLLHFAVLQLLAALPGTFHTRATGYGAILAYAVGLLVVVPASYGVAWLSFRAIEQPMVACGRVVARATRPSIPPAPAEALRASAVPLAPDRAMPGP